MASDNGMTLVLIRSLGIGLAVALLVVAIVIMIVAYRRSMRILRNLLPATTPTEAEHQCAMQTKDMPVAVALEIPDVDAVATVLTASNTGLIQR